MKVSLYLDWAEGFDPAWAAAFSNPIPLTGDVPVKHWLIDFDVHTGEVSAREITLEEVQAEHRRRAALFDPHASIKGKG